MKDKTNGQIQMTLLVLLVSLAQASPLNRDGMNQTQDLNQVPVMNKDTIPIQVSLPILENIGLAQVIPLIKEDMDPAQVVSQGAGKNKIRDQAQASLQAVNKVDLI